MNYAHDFDKAEPATPAYQDAFLHGAETDAYRAILHQPATFLRGVFWAPKDRRNTQDGQWTAEARPWAEWVTGFTVHPVKKHKAGDCIVLGSSIGGARKANAMDTMYAMGLDIDAGFPLDAMLDRLEELGLFCIVYTTHSHGKSGLQLKHDEVIRKLKIKPSELDLAQVQRFLREHDKSRYEESFIDAVTFADPDKPKRQVKSGVVIDLATPPLDKYRLIFPLAEPVKIIDLAETQADALAVWEDKITGLAREVLDVHFDVSCTDPSRLFYTPRHPKEAGEEWYAAIVRGDPLRFFDVPGVKKASYTGSRATGSLNPFELAGAGADGDGMPACFTPSGASLNEWHRTAKDRFQMADLLEDLCSDRIRVAGGEATGHVHIECPFEHEHSTEGGTACDARNALDSSSGYWTWGCHHDSCQGRRKLEFLEEALRQGWFNEDQLAPDSVYMLPGEDDSVIEDAPKDRAARHKERADSVRDDLLSLVDDFNADTSESEIREVIRLALKASADKAVQARLKEAVTARTPIGARAFNDLWKDEARQKQKPQGRSKPSGGIPAKSIHDDFADQVEYAQRRIVEANAERARLFQFGGAYATADAVRHRVRLIEDQPTMFTALHKITRWEKDRDSDGNTQGVAPPETVVKAVFTDHDFADTLPELLAVPSTPFFDAEGRLVDEDGYHAGAKVYLAKGDLVLPSVSREPTAIEVAEAKRLIVEEVLADFPLGGMDRAQIVGTLAGENADHAHAVTHAVAMTLLPFCRDMIAGPTPGHVYTKPGPGTGASLLVDVLTTIAGGSPAPAMTFPTRAEEVGKTLSAALAEGAPVILFDNIGQAIASSELASAMTGTMYQARILGKTQLVMVPVRSVWAFTANNIEASREILRRFVLIPLDAGVPDPEQRKPENGWQHPNLRQWVTDNRPALVWACLTLIQNWVARGMERQKVVSLASYEDWAGVMGGILTAAGFHGFLDGQAEERAKATDATEDGLAQLVQIMAGYPDGTVFRPGGTGRYDGKPTVSVMAILNGDERAKMEPGDKPDPIQINGWGYKDFDGQYTNATRIGRGMKNLARKPYQIGGKVVTFAEATDSKAGTSVYRMTKTG